MSEQALERPELFEETLVTLPVLNTVSLFDSTHPDHQNQKEILRYAITETGFLVLRSDPKLTGDKIGHVLDTYLRFFKSPDHIKQRVNMGNTQASRGWGAPETEQVSPNHLPDYKEVFDCGLTPPNLWPDIPDFEETLTRYFHDASDVALHLLMMIADIIGYPAAHFQSAFKTPMSLLRGNYYPPRLDSTHENQFGIAPHTDYGCITLLSSNTTKGLDIQTADQEWKSVQLNKGDIVINFGEMLEKWTDGFVRATPHRVIGSREERLSCVLFFNPAADTNIAPYHSGQVELAGDYLMKRYNETYLHLMNQNA